MKKFLLILAPVLIAAVLMGGILFVLNIKNAKGALQVTSVPNSQVYLDGKLIGQTPLCKCELSTMLGTGSYTIRLVPTEGNFVPFESRIEISSKVLTVVDRTFQEGAKGNGSIISLSPISDKNDSQILAISFPDSANLYLDNNLSGITPYLLKNITESDHEIKLSKDGFVDKSIRIKTVKGFKLELVVFLGLSDINNATSSATISAIPTPIPGVVKVEILSTPTGFLRVRSEASLNSSQIALVYPTEQYDFVADEVGWIQIKLKDGKLGWVSATYAKKITP